MSSFSFGFSPEIPIQHSPKLLTQRPPCFSTHNQENPLESKSERDPKETLTTETFSTKIHKQQRRPNYFYPQKKMRKIGVRSQKQRTNYPIKQAQGNAHKQKPYRVRVGVSWKTTESIRVEDFITVKSRQRTPKRRRRRRRNFERSFAAL